MTGTRNKYNEGINYKFDGPRECSRVILTSGWLGHEPGPTLEGNPHLGSRDSGGKRDSALWCYATGWLYFP